jgi:hypothetical protein
MRLGIAVVALVLLGASEAPRKKVTVEGWAKIEAENLTGAREAAIKDAQKRAIEMTAGIQIKAMMSDSSYATVKNEQAKFEQEVVSKIYSQTEGFVHGYKILKEGREAGDFKVTLEAEVNDIELTRQLSILAKLMAGARFPKMMFIVTEEYTGQDGKVVVVQEPTLQAVLEDALLAKGFDLVAQEQIKKLRAEEAQVFQEILTDDNKAAKFAMEYGAEYLITAVGRIKHTGYDQMGQKEHHGYAELSLKAINASSAAVVASNKEGGNSPANCFSEEELRVKAVRKVAPKIIDNLTARVLESWDRETQNGIRYSVKLYNVKSYRNEGQKFLQLLEKVPEVKQVKKLSYGGDRLEVEVFYPMVHDVSKLEAAIMTALEKDKAFRSLDVTYSRGRELNFKL